jgi:uroporphyrinogen decarboxylase
MPVETSKKKFQGLRVGALESRLKAEMERLISNMGGVPFVAPSMKEVPVEEHAEVFKFWNFLDQGKIDLLILFTGVGTKTLVQILSSKIPQEKIIEKLKTVPLLVRGPKPLRVLSEFGLKPAITVSEPNTWREILKILDEKMNLNGLNVAVQEYGESNRIFLAELVERGATLIPVSIYKAVLPDDLSPLNELINRIINKELDVLLFTNSTQVEHLVHVARLRGMAKELRSAVNDRVVASVGPTCTESLQKFGFHVDIEPERPMMGALVTQAAEESFELFQKMKSSGIQIKEKMGTKKSDQRDILHQSVFLKACRREPVPYTPIWLMRQAGRYLKEYRELRAKVSFIDLCKNSDLAAEVTVDAAHRLNVDAAIIFSDLLLLVEPMGFSLSYGKDQGPEIANPFRSQSQLALVKPVDVEDSMSYVYSAIRKTRTGLKPGLPLIGFAGAPFTMASYIIEGKGSKNFIHTKTLMYRDPDTWNSLLDKITVATIDYLNGQIKAGAQVIQIFDSWVGCLSPEDFRMYVLPHVKKLVKGIQPGIPVITFGTQNTGLLPLFKETKSDVIGVDWRVELDEAWDILGDVAIQGNLDPVILFSTPEIVRTQAKRILTQAGGRPGHIFNLGHGILPETPLDNVLTLIDTVHELSQERA